MKEWLKRDLPDVKLLGPLADDARSLPDRVAESIRSAIQQKKFGQGDQLPDTYHMARHFGVSRRTITSALQILNAEGTVRSVPRIGIFVRGVA